MPVAGEVPGHRGARGLLSANPLVVGGSANELDRRTKVASQLITQLYRIAYAENLSGLEAVQPHAANVH